MRKEGVAFLVLFLRPAGALVAVRPGAQRLQARLAQARSTTSATSGAAAAGVSARRCGCSRLPPTGSAVSRAQDLWRAASTAAETRRRGGRRAGGGSSLSATVAPWPAVEGTDSSSGGGARKRDAAAAGGGGVVLIEQEGPAWTEIVWDEVRGLAGFMSPCRDIFVHVRF